MIVNHRRGIVYIIFIYIISIYCRITSIHTSNPNLNQCSSFTKKFIKYITPISPHLPQIKNLSQSISKPQIPFAPLSSKSHNSNTSQTLSHINSYLILYQHNAIYKQYTNPNPLEFQYIPYTKPILFISHPSNTISNLFYYNVKSNIKHIK